MASSLAAGNRFVNLEILTRSMTFKMAEEKYVLRILFNQRGVSFYEKMKDNRFKTPNYQFDDGEITKANHSFNVSFNCKEGGLRVYAEFSLDLPLDPAVIKKLAPKLKAVYLVNGVVNELGVIKGTDSVGVISPTKASRIELKSGIKYTYEPHTSKHRWYIKNIVSKWNANVSELRLEFATDDAEIMSVSHAVEKLVFFTPGASSSSALSLLNTISPPSKFESLYLSQTLSDVTLVCAGGVSIYSHRFILYGHSPVFARMFDSEMVEATSGTVHIPDIEPDVMKEFLRFLYTQKVQNLETVAQGLYISAEKYMVTELQDICLHFLSQQVSLESAEEMFLFGNLHGEDSLVKLSLHYTRSPDSVRKIMKDYGSFQAYIRNYPKLTYQTLLNVCSSVMNVKQLSEPGPSGSSSSGAPSS